MHPPSKFRRIIGYEKLDNLFTGFCLGLISIALAYYFQVNYYKVDTLGSYGLDIKENILKLSLLGALFTFLILNYFDKVYAMKGVLISVILVAIYLVYLHFSH